MHTDLRMAPHESALCTIGCEYFLNREAIMIKQISNFYLVQLWQERRLARKAHQLELLRLEVNFYTLTLPMLHFSEHSCPFPA
jgi:hypothetical protein